MAKRQLRGAALTANVIKKRLTALYPCVKFSVTSETFSMGNSVSIRWTDGPPKGDIEKITSQYQYGNFNGMEDIYEYEAIDPDLGCDGAKYVSCSREISSKYKAQLGEKATEYYGYDLDPHDNSYYRRLCEIEELFFPYPVAEPKSTVATNASGSTIAGLEHTVIKDKDTRDDSVIYVVKIITKVDDFAALRQAMQELGGYYSRYKRGFIFQQDPTAVLKGDADSANDALDSKEDCA